MFLRVVSAATGEDLDSVTVMSRWMWRARIEELLPSEGRFTEEVARGALSPIALPDSAKRVTYWAKAPGYAWGMIHVDHEVGGERRLELAPASSLTVHVAGELPPPKEGEGDFVRLRRKSTGWHWNFAASRSVPEEGPTEFEGLPAGRYLVCYERGDEEGARRGVEQWVDVPEAIDSKVTLTPDVAQLEPPTGRVFGSLYLPVDEREAKHIRLGLTPLDESGGGRPVQLRVKAMQAVDGEEHEYRWDAGELVPGAYIAYVSSLQHRVVFDVVADCENEVRIAVPELATLWLEVVDAIDGSALREAQVRWSDGDLEGVSRNQQIDAPRDARSKRWKLVAPAGTIQFSVHLEGYGEHYETLELAAGESTRRIELSSSTGLRITFVEAGVPVRAEFRSWSWVNAKSIVAGAPTDPVGLGFGRSTEFVRELFIEDPGEYELTFGELEGFAPIPPRRVEVVANEVLSFEVELVRQ